MQPESNLSRSTLKLEFVFWRGFPLLCRYVHVNKVMTTIIIIRPALGPTQPPVQWAPSLLLGGKEDGAWRWPPTSSSAEVKERVEL